MYTLRSVMLGGASFQFVFTRLSAMRLSTPAGSDRLEPVDMVVCEVLDEDLQIVATGRSIKADTDDFSLPKGLMLSLARALDDAEVYGWWRHHESIDVIELMMETYPETVVASECLTEDDWDTLDACDTHTQVVKVLLPFIGKPPVALDEGSGVGNDPSVRFGYDSGEFDLIDIDMDAGIVDGIVAAPPTSLHDDLRRLALEHGIHLDTTDGELSVSDICRIYKVASLGTD